jgi:hypothetical protein
MRSFIEAEARIVAELRRRIAAGAEREAAARALGLELGEQVALGLPPRSIGRAIADGVAGMLARARWVDWQGRPRDVSAVALRVDLSGDLPYGLVVDLDVAADGGDRATATIDVGHGGPGAVDDAVARLAEPAGPLSASAPIRIWDDAHSFPDIGSTALLEALVAAPAAGSLWAWVEGAASAALASKDDPWVVVEAGDLRAELRVQHLRVDRSWKWRGEIVADVSAKLHRGGRLEDIWEADGARLGVLSLRARTAPLPADWASIVDAWRAEVAALLRAPRLPSAAAVLGAPSCFERLDEAIEAASR